MRGEVHPGVGPQVHSVVDAGQDRVAEDIENILLLWVEPRAPGRPTAT